MPEFERSYYAFRHFGDEHIDYWAGVYLANPHLRSRGVLFETFLVAPVELLHACGRPLLRADFNRAVHELDELTVARLAPESRCAAGAWIEKLRHHAWPRHAPRKPETEA